MTSGMNFSGAGAKWRRRWWRGAAGAAVLGAAGALGAATPVESIGGQEAPRAARSVHLQWSAAESEAFLLELTVEQTTPGSFFMACGWSGGYFGMQELRDGKRVAIFSVWDPTKGDDPKAVRLEDRVEVLHEGEGVRIKRFGGEGTGGQGMTDFAWEAGAPVRFLVRAEAHPGADGTPGGKTAYAGWIQEPRSGAWRHLVTFRTRNGGKLLRGLNSFVEDFRRDGKSVHEVRRARFGNGWMKAPGGVWTPLTAARFTASRAAWEARDTIDAGAREDGGGYFLVTGGGTVRTAELAAALPAIRAATRRPEGVPEMPRRVAEAGAAR
jgi:hypothetical protein